MAATHPRMNDMGCGAYHIAPQRGGWFKVQPPHESLADRALTVRIAKHLDTKRRQLEYLLQSQDWTQLPPYERVLAEELYAEIDALQQRFELDATILNGKYLRGSQKIQRAMQDKASHSQLPLLEA
jgi:hypothetical protein